MGRTKTLYVVVWILLLATMSMIWHLVTFNLSVIQKVRQPHIPIPTAITKKIRETSLSSHNASSRMPTTSSVPDVATLSSESVFAKGPLITSVEALSKHPFIFIVHKSTGRYLSRPLESNVDLAARHEKVWKITFHERYLAYSVMAHTRHYLTCELDNKVSVDRIHARSFEMWTFHFEKKNRIVGIASYRNRKFLGPHTIDGRTLIASESMLVRNKPL